MNALLDDASVAAGILDITQREGVNAVTARSLAGHLHVSLGALYNYMASMPAAMQNADVHVYQAMTAAMNAAQETTSGAASDPEGRRTPDIRAQRDALWSWAQRELPFVDLIADLSRPHAPLPESFLDLLPPTTKTLPSTTQTAEIVRSFAGLWRAGSPELTSVDLAMVTELLATSLDSYDPAAHPNSAGTPLDSLPDVASGAIALRPHHRIDEDVRAASVKVLLEGQWSFRNLQEKTGHPLARLNRMSPRNEHVRLAVSDIIGGIVLQHASEGRPRADLVHNLVSTIAMNPKPLIESQLPFLSLSLVARFSEESAPLIESDIDIHQTMLVGGLSLAVLHAGHMNRDTEPEFAAASLSLAIDVVERSQK